MCEKCNQEKALQCKYVFDDGVVYCQKGFVRKKSRPELEYCKKHERYIEQGFDKQCTLFGAYWLKNGNQVCNDYEERKTKKQNRLLNCIFWLRKFI